MTVNEDLFVERYNNLNEEQRDAVNSIYGPVMVIAGPGTGKTEVLSMRIANLLRSEAQVQPHEILCLTYTDEAANSMRRRLLQVIGVAAHKVNILTFHAFCNNVIQSNSEYFSLRTLQPIDDLERTELLYKMIEGLPQGHLLRRLSGDIYFDISKLRRLFDMMKQEHLSHEHISANIDAYIEDLPMRDEYVYKKNGKDWKKGDLKQGAIDEEVKKMEVTRAAAGLYEVYQKYMDELGRYDFTDMLLWVLEAFKSYPNLLLSYQERHQFILVDEFQDTNGAQNELIKQLTDFWEDPNIFVVGDDDQSIYEFQGARIKNIIEFYEKYKETIKVVVLPQNYRSSQPILDKASATIKNNKERLIHQLKELNLNKDIVSSAERFKDGNDSLTPIVKTYNNILQEEADIVMQIEALQREGVALSNVAILYSQHRQADNVIALMERKGIPYNVKKPVNILDSPLIQQVINIIRYLDEERKKPLSAEYLLFEIMHAPYYGIAATDIASLALHMQANKSKDRSLAYWRLVLAKDLLLESLNLKSVATLRRLGMNMDRWQRDQLELPLPLFVEKVIYESGIVNYLLQTKDKIWNIQILHTFFEYVKDLYSRNQRLKPAELLRTLDRMQDEKIPISIQRVIQNEHGVYFYTAHGAKGNEFEHVFLIGATKNYWEAKKGGGNEYRLPDTITNTKDDKEKTYKEEVARRLFYVALTRAKKHLHISYSINDNQGKGQEASVFIDEICPVEERITQSVAAEDMLRHMEWAMVPVPDVQIQLANGQWIERVLQQFTMSYTTLSKYLRCPLTFYYECILKVPFLKNDALAFGSAVHYALERMFKDMKANKDVFPTKEEVIDLFNISLYTESECFTPVQYERRKEQGHTILSEYYDHYINAFSKNVEIEYKIQRFVLQGVPVTGKVDKIEINGDSCNVIDYKTGDPGKWASAMVAGPNEKNPDGGDYWRQMVFYKLLLENNPDKNWRVDIGMFDYIQKGGYSKEYKQLKVPMFANDETTVVQQMKNAYAGIMNHEFDKGCGKPECYWCNFARKYELLKTAKEEVEIDDL